MAKMGFDPLACIPSSEAIRERLAELTEELRRLNILLQTAERIEQKKGERDHQDEASS